MKKIFSLFAAVLFAGSMMAAAVETVNFSEQGYTNGQAITSYEGTIFSIAFDKGTNSNSNAPKYYTTGSAIRCYSGNSMTITSSQNIVAIELTFASGEGSNDITSDPEGYKDGAWAGSATSVKLTIGGSTGHRRIATVTVTTEGEGPEPVLADGYYLVGSFNEWTPANGYKFAANTETEGEWYLSKVLSVGDEFKVRQVEGGEATVWFPAEAGNYVVDALHAGANSRHIYFRPDYQGGDDWHAHCIFVERNPINLGEKTIAEFLELKNFKDTCILKGTVANIVMDKTDPTIYNKYGNFDIVDETGSLYVYGLLTADGQTQKFREMGVDAGDILTIKAIYSEYNNNPQAQNAIYVSHIEGGATAVDNTEVNAKAVKFFENGQLVIIKNGVKYNATGAIIK